MFNWWCSIYSVQADAVFELISICQEYALFLMKKAAMVGMKDEADDADLKNIHVYLRTAAGIFDKLKAEWIPKLRGQQLEAGSDNDPAVMEAYYYQCIAEAEESKGYRLG